MHEKTAIEEVGLIEEKVEEEETKTGRVEKDRRRETGEMKLKGIWKREKRKGVRRMRGEGTD